VRAAPEDRMLSDTEWPRSQYGSCTGPGSPTRAMIWGCGGWRSGTPPTTSTLSPRWPARTEHGRRSGTTTTRSGTPATTRNAGSDCGPPPRPIAPPPAARPGRKRNRRPGAAGRSRPG
jgi:hypothetical protein